MHRFVLAGSTLTVLAACQPATTDLTEEQKVEIAAEVDSVANDLWAAWAAADFDRGICYNVPITR